MSRLPTSIVIPVSWRRRLAPASTTKHSLLARSRLKCATCITRLERRGGGEKEGGGGRRRGGAEKECRPPPPTPPPPPRPAHPARPARYNRQSMNKEVFAAV